MLLGRDRECQAIERLLTEARDGRSGIVVLVGEPGIGKTVLLDYAREQAQGMRVLRARGIESEAQVPFAGLLELLRPALGVLDGIPQPQASALSAALALGPAGPQNRFAVGAATLSLLAAYAEEAPLVLLVDDVHWLDAPSGEAVLFAIRRLVADPIAAILATRDSEPSVLGGTQLPELRLGGLDRAAAAALLAREADQPVDAVLAERLYGATGGNPLALLELAPEAPQLAGPIDAPVPVSTSIAQTFLRRAGLLPDETRRLLLLAAVSDTGDFGVVERAAVSLGLDIASLLDAESAGLVRVHDGVIEFRHPLARSAVYGEAPGDERRAAHRALAQTLPDRDADRRAWHLAAAALGPDDGVAAALEQAGYRASERTAYTTAATAFERAARLSTTEARRGALLYASAEAAWVAGLADRAVALLVEARSLEVDASTGIGIDHLRGYVTMRRGDVMEGHAILCEAAERAAQGDPDRAVVMLAEAANACFYAGRADEMLRTAERAAVLLPATTGEEAAFLGRIAQGMAFVFGGEGGKGAALIREAVALVEASPQLRRNPRLLTWAAMGPIWLREAGEARALVDEAVDTARQQAAIGVLPFLLNHTARDQAASDRWTAGQAGYHEAIRLGRETGQRTELAAGLAGLAWLEARQGREDACRGHAAEARALCASLGIGLYEIWSIAALGDLELGLGRAQSAVDHLEEQRARLDALGILDVDLSPAAELVDAYLRLGRSDEAAATTETFAAQARAKGQPWSLARLARCRGLLASDDELEVHFDEALRLHELTPDLFETARTRLAFGSRLRRGRQRVRARHELRAALELFDRLGAAPWSELTRVELQASGETARRRDASTIDTLTPQELQIALLLAEGKTTREAAAALFLSPKTIEYHLRHVYRKLEIGSRTELASALRSI